MKRLLFILLTGLFFILVLINSGLAQDTSVPLPIQIYEKVWNEQNSESRLKMIQTIWVAESTYEDPTVFTKGPVEFNDMITKFFVHFPGAVLTRGKILSTKGKFHTWPWEIFDATHKPILTGRDAVEINDKGQIVRVTGFFEPAIEPAKLQENANITVVSKYYECLFKTRDFNTMATLLGESSIYSQAEGLPYGGEYIGFANLTKMFIHASSLFDLQIEKEPTYFTDATTEGVIIRFTIKCTLKKSGKIISMPIAEHFEVRNGKIISIRPFYFDTLKFTEFLK